MFVQKIILMAYLGQLQEHINEIFVGVFTRFGGFRIEMYFFFNNNCGPALDPPTKFVVRTSQNYHFFLTSPLQKIRKKNRKKSYDVEIQRI